MQVADAQPTTRLLPAAAAGIASASLDQALALQTMHVMHDIFSCLGTGAGGGLLKLAIMVGLDGLKGAVGAVLAASAAWALRPSSWAGALAHLRVAIGAFWALLGKQLAWRRNRSTGAGGLLSRGLRAATHVAFTPHPLFWQHLVVRALGKKRAPLDDEADGKRDDAEITWAVHETALEQPDLDTTVVRETWTDVHVASRSRSLVASVEGALHVELTYKSRDGRSEPASMSVARAATLSCTSSGGAWETYADLIPFEGFREDLQEWMLKCNTPIRCDDCAQLGLWSQHNRFTAVSDLGNRAAIDVFDQLNTPGAPTCIRDRSRRAWCFAELYHLLALVAGTVQVNKAKDIDFVESLNVVDAVRLSSRSTLFGVPISNEALWKLPRNGVAAYPHVSSMKQGAEVRIWLLRQLVPEIYQRVLQYEGKVAAAAAVMNSPEAADDTANNGILNVSVACGAGAIHAAAAWRRLVEAVVAGAQQVHRSGAAAQSVGVYIVKAVVEDGGAGAAGVPNPAYTDWAERRDCLKALVQDLTTRAGKDGESGSGGAAAAAAVEALASFTREPAPPRTLERDGDCGTTRVARVERVGEVCKCLSTLYLRHADMRVLRGSIDLYASRGDDMRALGLPHKLGVLLHGEPGTGKSSTIAAIATHLRKDIYYLHLGGVRRNDDLRMLFEHVTRNCANGGVVVMEDIDAMAPVVLRRGSLPPASSASSECSSDLPAAPLSEGGCGGGCNPGLADLMDAGGAPLTLDYFLNLLQGTLTVDGMVFVATTNRLEALDPAFYRPGRFDVVLNLGACDRDQVQLAFQRFMGRPPAAEVLARVREGVHTPASVVARLAQFVCTPAEGADDAHVLAPFLEQQ